MWNCPWCSGCVGRAPPGGELHGAVSSTGRSAPRGGQLHGGANPSPTAPRILVDPRHLHETPPKGNGRWRLVRF
jgi:hypothetical protein